MPNPHLDSEDTIPAVFQCLTEAPNQAMARFSGVPSYPPSPDPPGWPTTRRFHRSATDAFRDADYAAGTWGGLRPLGGSSKVWRSLVAGLVFVTALAGLATWLLADWALR